jgi:hypothetical protein
MITEITKAQLLTWRDCFKMGKSDNCSNLYGQNNVDMAINIAREEDKY